MAALLEALLNPLGSLLHVLTSLLFAGFPGCRAGCPPPAVTGFMWGSFVKEVFGKGEQEGNHCCIAFDHPYGNAVGKKGEERAVGLRGDGSVWLSV